MRSFAELELSIIVPAFNEAKRLPSSLRRLIDTTDPRTTELIIVDDGSTDGTSGIAKEILSRRPSSLVIRLPYNQGKGAAVRTGVAKANGSAIAYMDADLAADISDLPRLLDGLTTAHVVVGSRALSDSVTTGTSWARTHMGRTFNRLARLATGVPILDFQCPLKAMRATSAKLLFYLSRVDGYTFDVEILTLAHQFGFEVAEVPIRFAAMPGSHIKPVRDSLRMATELAHMPLRHGSRRLVTAIEAFAHGPQTGDESAQTRDESAAVLVHRLGGVGPVIRWRRGAIALLPFVDPLTGQELAQSLALDLPDLEVRASVIRAADFFTDDNRQLRAALAAG